jgi:hypothetical protein
MPGIGSDTHPLPGQLPLDALELVWWWWWDLVRPLEKKD